MIRPLAMPIFRARTIVTTRALCLKKVTVPNINSRAMGSQKRCVTLENMNPNLVTMEYAVRGPIIARAGDIEKELSKGVEKPFDEVIKANIGDGHAMGQVPITFIRQVLALVTYPELFQHSYLFPEDVIKRAQDIIKDCKGNSIGAYTEIPGIESIRRHVAEYIERRDNVPCQWENVILSAGASSAIKALLRIFIHEVDGKKPGILIPIPQYPLYSATIAEYGMVQIGYYLDEYRNWSLDIPELERAIHEARKTCNPRALVIINPGNPTGQVLSRENIEEIIRFAQKENLFLLADEVYQDNIYENGSQFYSFKKVLSELGAPYNEMELASFMSCSKGYMGECGLRGGYMELINICPKVRAVFHKAISASLCPNTTGQFVIDCITSSPKEGEPSYKLYIKEKAEILGSLAERAKLIADTFNSFEGFSCNPVQGAMYAFPQIKLPPKAIEAAKKKGMPADTFYAYELLENTGICIVPGSGFGQRSDTYHFRTTILPKIDKLKVMLQKFSKFHNEFVKKYK